VNADQTAASLAELDPESRALLELSMVRGLSDEDLSSMLGTETDRLRERREAVLDSLGVRSESQRFDLAASLRGGPLATERAPRRVAEPKPLTADLSGDEPSPSRGPRRIVWALVGGLMVAAVVALALALGTNEDGEEGTAPGAPGSAAEPDAAPPAGAPPVALSPLGAGPGEATAQIAVRGGDPRLRLTVRGLPRAARGGYVVWLYNSISEARELTGSRSGTFSVRPPLPPEADGFRFIDVSREPADGNRNHSGASLLRVPIEDIPRTSR